MAPKYTGATYRFEPVNDLKSMVQILSRGPAPGTPAGPSVTDLDVSLLGSLSRVPLVSQGQMDHQDPKASEAEG